MIAEQRLTEKDVYYVEREVNPGVWKIVTRVAQDFETAQAWAHADNARVVLVRTQTFVVTDQPNGVVPEGVSVVH